MVPQDIAELRAAPESLVLELQSHRKFHSDARAGTTGQPGERPDAGGTSAHVPSEEPGQGGKDPGGYACLALRV